MLNINIVNGVSDLEVELPFFEEKNIFKYNSSCVAGVDYKLVLTPLKPEFNNHSYFTPVITFLIDREIEAGIVNLFKLKGAICFQLKDFHVHTNLVDLEDCIYETYNQILLYIEKNTSKAVRESPFPLLTSEQIYPHLLECIQMVYPEFRPKPPYSLL